MKRPHKPLLSLATGKPLDKKKLRPRFIEVGSALRIERRLIVAYLRRRALELPADTPMHEFAMKMGRELDALKHYDDPGPIRPDPNLNAKVSPL